MTVCDPVSRDVIEVELPMSGRLGRPSEAVSTTVPVSGGTEVWPATSASTWAGVRAGRVGAACATEISDPASTPPRMTTTPTGTAHRARLDSLATPNMTPHP